MPHLANAAFFLCSEYGYMTKTRYEIEANKNVKHHGVGRFLRKAGYNVLVLGFYLWEGLPKELVSIPVDYNILARKPLPLGWG